MTKMATMPIYGKNALKVLFSKTNKLMTFKLSMQHLELGHYKVCSSDESGRSLTFFMATTSFEIFKSMTLTFGQQEQPVDVIQSEDFVNQH